MDRAGIWKRKANSSLCQYVLRCGCLECVVVTLMMMVIKVSEPETRGSYLKKHTTFLVSEAEGAFKVRRRFSDFEWLHHVLRARYVGMLVPSVPEKNVLKSDAFIQSRMRGLTMFLEAVLQSPYLKSDIAVASFLTKTDELEWEQAKKVQ